MEIKSREKILAIALGACILFWLLNLVVFAPVARSWHDRSVRIADLKKSIADGNLLLRRQAVIDERWDRMRTNALPANSTLAESRLFNAFDSWIRESGVTQGSFRPQLKETDDNYSTVDCRADVTGDMQGVLRFLYDLEKDPMALKLNSVELTSRDDNGSQLALVVEISGLMLPAPEQ